MPAKTTCWYYQARQFPPWLWLAGFIPSLSWAADAFRGWLVAAGEGEEAVLTGKAPVRLSLKLAHALNRKGTKL